MILSIKTKIYINVIIEKTIYNLINKYKQYVEVLDTKFTKEHSNIGKQFKLQILKNFIFLRTTPLMFGIKVLSGILKSNTIVSAIKGDKEIVLGKVTSMQRNKKDLDVTKVNDELCIRIEGNIKLTYGDDFDDSYTLIRYLNHEDKNITEFIESLI